MNDNLTQLLKEAESAIRAGDTDQAEHAYSEALKLDPQSASAHYGIGTIAMQRNHLDVALTSLRRAQELEPEAVDIAFNLAHCFNRLGERRQTLVQLQHATRYCKADPVFCSRISDFFVRLGEPAAAIQLLSRLEVMPPADQITLARAQAGLSNWREAVHILRRLNEVLPEEAEISNQLAVAAGKLRDFDTAINAFERYLRQVTPTAEDYLRFADLLLMAQKAERSGQAIQQAMDLGEDSAEIYVMHAKVARLNADYSAGNEALEKAIERMPNHGQAWAMRAELATDEQLPSLIETLFPVLQDTEALTQLNHQHRALLFYAMADMQERTGNIKEASAALEQANAVQFSFLESTRTMYNPAHMRKSVDRRIEYFDRETFDAPDASLTTDANTPQPIFIVGMPRSGTTLVERIIGQNPQVHSAGEQEAMEFVAADFNQKAESGKLPVPKEITPQQWSELRRLYLEKLPDMSRPIFTDKLPHNFRHVGLIHKLFPEARIVQMHRDKRDVCMSIYSHAFAPGHNYANRWEDLSSYYDECERLMAHWSSMNSPRILDLNYEDLVQNPEYYAQQLIEFCGFAWDSSYLEFHKSINKSFTFSEMQVRQPIADKRVGRWRAYAEFFPQLSDD